jgi:murein DD-endopeptidase MepM/ murein hydrolase activator NlpD
MRLLRWDELATFSIGPLLRSGLIILVFAWLPASAVGATETLPADNYVRIIEQRENSMVTLVAQMTNCTEATVSCELTLTNAIASRPLPLTLDTAGRDRVEIVIIQRLNPRLYWGYSYKCRWRQGRRSTLRKSDYGYSLPYQGGPFRVVQGYLGKFSHGTGSGNEHAIDWRMPIGTRVCAARSGIVTGIRQDSDVGGSDPKYKCCGNYIVIKHDDGTFAEYAHLAKESALVNLGEKVAAGQTLALSGNTGFSRGPHLHFAVFVTIDGNTRATIPVRFQTPQGGLLLEEGKDY